jgi:hypothetical protein
MEVRQMAETDSSFFLVNVGSSNLERYAKISPQDAELILRYKWRVTSSVHGRGNTIFYAYTSSGGRGVKKVKMHRLILDAPDGMHVDHINGDGLDNRRRNLRACTAQQNLMNQRPRRSASGLKGVKWMPKIRKWMARIKVDGRELYLGVFVDRDDAGRAYDAAATQYFGQFARLNFPECQRGT